MKKYLLRLLLAFNTVRQLKPIQIYYLYIRRLFAKKETNISSACPEFIDFNYLGKVSSNFRYIKSQNNSIKIFDELSLELNKKDSYESCDYLVRFSSYYLEYLNQESIDDQLAAETAKRICDSEENIDGWRWHPYTVSKRIISLSIWLSRHSIEERIVAESYKDSFKTELYKCCCFLKKNIEFEIDGNHLLTNYAALAIGWSFFSKSEANDFLKRYIHEFSKQFKSKIHYERSYAYTLQLLNEALTLCVFSHEVKNKIRNNFLNSLEFSILMHKHGAIYFGDSIFEQTPSLKEIIERSSHLFQYPEENLISNVDSKEFINIDGYICWRSGEIRGTCDAGSPSPSFQPGHAHDSTSAVSIMIKDSPLVISNIITTYERGLTRSLQRSRRSYSRIQSSGSIQEIWSAFRVGRRRNTIISPIESGSGFKINVEGNESFIERSIALDDHSITIVDTSNSKFESRYQFLIAPGVEVFKEKENQVKLNLKNGSVVSLSIDGASKIETRSRLLGVGYGKFAEGTVIRLNAKPNTKLSTNWSIL